MMTHMMTHILHHTLRQSGMMTHILHTLRHSNMMHDFISDSTRRWQQQQQQAFVLWALYLRWLAMSLVLLPPAGP